MVILTILTTAKSRSKNRPIWNLTPETFVKTENYNPVGNLDHCRLTTKKWKKIPFLNFPRTIKFQRICPVFGRRSSKMGKIGHFPRRPEKKREKLQKFGLVRESKPVPGRGTCVVHTVLCILFNKIKSVPREVLEAKTAWARQGLQLFWAGPVPGLCP